MHLYQSLHCYVTWWWDWNPLFVLKGVCAPLYMYHTSFYLDNWYLQHLMILPRFYLLLASRYDRIITDYSRYILLLIHVPLKTTNLCLNIWFVEQSNGPLSVKGQTQRHCHCHLYLPSTSQHREFVPLANKKWFTDTQTRKFISNLIIPQNILYIIETTVNQIIVGKKMNKKRFKRFFMNSYIMCQFGGF